MALLLITGPTLEPVSLAEAKAHLRVETDDEDSLIGTLITSARLYVEARTRLALITQTWSWFIDDWPGRLVELPRAPLQALEAVKLWPEEGSATLLDPASYEVDTLSRPPRLRLDGAQGLPLPGRTLNGIEITLRAGFGDAAADVPADLRQAILFAVTHWFENREPVSLGGAGLMLPAAMDALLAPYRSFAL